MITKEEMDQIDKEVAEWLSTNPRLPKTKVQETNNNLSIEELVAHGERILDKMKRYGKHENK